MAENTTTPEDNWTDNLVRARENIVQGVGLPGALLGAYALGNKPKKGSRIPGVLGAVGGAYLGKTLYDFAANNDSTKKYISDFTNFVDKHTGGVGGQYVPMAAQAIGGLLGYGLLKSSNYNMYKYAGSSPVNSAADTIKSWIWPVSAAAAATGTGYGIYRMTGDVRDLTANANVTIDNFNNKVIPAMVDAVAEVKDSTNATSEEANKLIAKGQDTLNNVDNQLNTATDALTDKIPGVLAIGGLTVGIPLAVYLANRNKKSKKPRKEQQ